MIRGSKFLRVIQGNGQCKDVALHIHLLQVDIDFKLKFPTCNFDSSKNWPSIRNIFVSFFNTKVFNKDDEAALVEVLPTLDDCKIFNCTLIKSSIGSPLEICVFSTHRRSYFDITSICSQSESS